MSTTEWYKDERSTRWIKHRTCARIYCGHISALTCIRLTERKYKGDDVKKYPFFSRDGLGRWWGENQKIATDISVTLACK